ncbi:MULTISPECIES: ABC transporter ATP-binding protein [Paenibacillus]|uniref:ABC transporter ATP-binding protein n=1 Tax=Paenibacillus cucumis (ex Kampfer et al. 2016) TaxID=1776858 RepID=A0ABS7KNQ8_9BACL|nr:ABC transporter ATP-binding protein [Paenibacillus cucumis (ex Kampfer et al. 2016)]MBY0205724.1 ABC transporter ATP-binding protein [Paenibacillus cucumis (ex Kampfer et al. 2016)]MDP9701962.1 peptide/nickel transport system ATP-binding protein [Paenibacillus intestini]
MTSLRGGTTSLLVEMKNLSVSYKEGVPSLRDVSFSMKPGEIIGIVGESGSGKSTLIRALLGLLPVGGRYTGGEIIFRERVLLRDSQQDWQGMRGKRIAMVFQDSGSYLNPIRSIGSQYVEAIRAHLPMSRKEAWKLAIHTLARMGLDDPERVMHAYASQLSGGMKQRTSIAMAAALEPELLLADEPTSALDVTTQNEVMNQLSRLCADKGTGMMLVTHNMAVAAHMAERIGVMLDGRLVELGDTLRVISNPDHEYTRKLLEAVPELEGNHT